MPIIPVGGPASIPLPAGYNTVGNVILSAREMFTDRAQVLNPPGTELKGTLIGNAPSTLTWGTYYVKLCYRTGSAINPWGETLPGPELGPFVVDAQHSIQIQGTQQNTYGAAQLPAGATAVVAYYGSQGGEYQYVVSTSIPFAIGIQGQGGYPPTRNTAYLPDSNGDALSAAAIYRWINDGLKLGSEITNGIPDHTACPTVDGQPVYTLPGNWKKINGGWYDGYPLYMGRQNDVFRRNAVPGTVALSVTRQLTDRTMVECWPQPARTSGNGTTTAAMGLADIVANVNVSGWVLGFGLAQIGTEIVEYAALDNNQLVGLTRGMAGTVPMAWPAGTVVNELNLEFSGSRVPTPYGLGMSGSVLNLEPGWDQALQVYLESRFLKLEKQYKESKALLDEFTATMQQMKSNRIVFGPRQVQANAGRGAETYPGLGGPFGGVLVP